MNQYVRHALDTASVVRQSLCEELDQIKLLLDCADRALRNGASPTTVEEQARETFGDFVGSTVAWLGPDSPLDDEDRQRIGERLRRELLPLLLLSENAERWYGKPRGYAGDYYTIEMIYRDEPCGVGALGQLIDRCFLDLSAAQAVRNRRPLLAREIARTIEGVGDRRAQVTSLACGPARELFDAFAEAQRTETIQATLLDIDFQALAFVADERDRLGLRRQMRLVNENLIHLAQGRRKLDLEPQDLVYSIGLIDYFPDELVVRLIDWIYDSLRPGGRVILGNFHPANSSRPIMDHVLDWKLIHRAEQDMHALFEASKFGREATRIVFEEQQINLFAECVR